MAVSRLDDDDLGRIEQALATISGIAPRGWVAADGPLVRVGNVRANGILGHGLTVMTGTRHSDSLEMAAAIAVVLNDAGKLLYDLRTLREARP